MPGKNMKIEDHVFPSEGTNCAGWLFLPEHVAYPPVVVMAHGIAAERNFRLPAFARRFVQKGLAVFLFDYRNFGDSEGKPRHLVNPYRHIQDWFAALEYIRSLGVIDARRLALWGTSFSGGHVLVVAARDGRIAGVVSQVPFVDGFSTIFTFPLSYLIPGSYHGFRDLWRKLIGKGPHYIKVVDEPGSFALLNTPECLRGYRNLVPEDTVWENRCPARILLQIPTYRPIRYASGINCPVLIVYGEKDSLIPAGHVRKTARKIKNCHTVARPTGHFDLYYGKEFEEIVKIEGDFLQKVLS